MKYVLVGVGLLAGAIFFTISSSSPTFAIDCAAHCQTSAYKGTCMAKCERYQGKKN
jgi:hypothetical protein